MPSGRSIFVIASEAQQSQRASWSVWIAASCAPRNVDYTKNRHALGRMTYDLDQPSPTASAPCNSLGVGLVICPSAE